MTRQNVVLGPRGLVLPLRRDCPEILLPAGATPGNSNLAASDTYGAYAQICSKTQFGTKPLIVAGVALQFSVGVSLSANAAAGVNREGRWEVAAGEAGSEVVFAEGNLAGTVTYGVSGIVDDPVAISVNGMFSQLYPIAPVRLDPVRLAFRGTRNDALTDAAVFNAHAVAYDPDAFNFQRPLLQDELIIRGQTDARSEQTGYGTVTSAAGSFANSAWADLTVNGATKLAHDYYVESAYLGQDQSVFARTIEYDFATLADGATADRDEVVQSRGAVLRSAVGGSVQSFTFPGGPFLAYKGETIRFRVRRQISAVTCYAMLQLRRINTY